MYLLFLWRGTCHFRAQKSLNFQGPPLPMPHVMMLHPSKPLSTSAIKTTGTLVVLSSRVLLCSVVVCKRGSEVSLQLSCVRRYSGVGGLHARMGGGGVLLYLHKIWPLPGGQLTTTHYSQLRSDLWGKKYWYVMYYITYQYFSPTITYSYIMYFIMYQ